MRIAVVGATGHTGGLVVPALLARGATLVACGRDPEALHHLEFLHPGLETRRLDVRDAAAVREALADVDAVANLAGPFTAAGMAVVEAAVERGMPYADTTGEQSFMRAVREKHHVRAMATGACVVNALAYEYALADLAAHLHFAEGGDALHVLYRARGRWASAGTKKSMARILAGPSLSYENGELVPEPVGAHARTFATDDGPRDAVSFPGGEPLTVPRHAPFRTVRSYMPANPERAKLVKRLGRLAPRLLRGPVLRAVEKVIDARHEPSARSDAGAEIHLVAERAAPDGHDARVVVHTPDPYLTTAEVLAEGLVGLFGAPRSGVLAPAEALDAGATLHALTRRLPGFRVQGPEKLP